MVSMSFEASDTHQDHLGLFLIDLDVFLAAQGKP